MENIMTWIRANKTLAIIGGLIAAVIFFKPLRKMVFGSPTRRRRRPVKVKTVIRGNRVRSVKRGGTKSGKPIPRSAGRSNGRGYPKAGGGYIPFKRNKDGSIKKAWQVAGTVAAKQRMARLRRNK
jgi:hypothetical protein